MNMDAAKAMETVNFVFKDIFGRDNPFTLGEIQKRFAFDLAIPVPVKDDVTGKDTWSKRRRNVSAMSMQTGTELQEKGTIPKPKKIDSLNDILSFWRESAYFLGDRYVNSIGVSESDNIFDSNSVYKSSNAHNCQNAVLSEDNSNCKQIVACRFNNAVMSCIRVLDSTFTTSSFAVMWSKKVSKCMYVNNSFDLYECMFCSNIDTKKYCIGNMQFTKEEYLPIKEMVIDWTIENFGKGNTMGF